MNHQALHRISLLAAIQLLASCEPLYKLQEQQVERQANLMKKLYPSLYSGARNNWFIPTGGTTYRSPEPASRPEPQEQPAPTPTPKKDSWR